MAGNVGGGAEIYGKEGGEKEKEREEQRRQRDVHLETFKVDSQGQSLDCALRVIYGPV